MEVTPLMVANGATDPEIVFLRARGRLFAYVVYEVGCDIGGRGFMLRRLTGGETYQVRVGEPRDCECSCKAFIRWRACKHVYGVMEMLAMQGRG